jgi:peptide/nickel transport system substrate-binding protein
MNGRKFPKKENALMKLRPVFVILAFAVLLATLLAGCGNGENATVINQPNVSDQSDPEEPAPTPTPVPVSLVVCLGEAPNTLYPYGSPNQTARMILQAIYDGPVDHRGYEFQPVILDGLPDIAAGTAVFQTAQVEIGDLVVDNQGNVAELELGTFIRPAGCIDGDCAVPFEGEPIEMDQMAALFSIRPGVAWSDGMPVTVDDSVYGFELNADPSTVASTYKLSRTLSYEAVDGGTVQWTGIPGFIDPNYQQNFWMPAPRHAWGNIPAAELPADERSTGMPLGYGPFVITDVRADTYTLTQNHYYFRTGEGLPRVDQLVYRVVGQDPEVNLDMLRTGECDLLDTTAAAGISAREVATLVEEGTLTASFANHNGWTLLNFGIVPQSYDDEYSVWAGDRPDFFGDVRVRQAVAMCLDREAIVAEASQGFAPVMDSYIPPDHALFNQDVTVYRQDLEGAGDLLDEVGWVLNTEGLRVASEIPGINNGTLFSFELLYPSYDENTRVVEMVSEQLAACGIEAIPTAMGDEELFGTGEYAPIFGRNFEMAFFAWQSAVEPPCQLFLGEAIPGPDEEIFPYKWGGWNPTGWQNEAYDAACEAARGSVPGMEEYGANHALVQQILSDELPIIPMYSYQYAALARPDLCGLELDPTAGLLWNIEEIGYGESCQ